MYKKHINIFILFVFLSFAIKAQEITLNVYNSSIDKVLLNIRTNYKLQLSFNNDELSKYKITVNQKFVNPDKCLEFLLKNIPYQYKKIGEVYTIYPKKIVKKIKRRIYRIAGIIRDHLTGEVLPYAHLLINQKGTTTDEKGAFSFVSSTDSIFKIKISYLGYYILDTLVGNGINKVFDLMPTTIGIEQVLVEGKKIKLDMQLYNDAGTMNLNNRIATFLPGNGDNSVYNYLRLQPGVLASGESSKEFIIWSSHENQSMIQFDGATIFTLKNFNDNISTINPMMVKNIKIHKGGYDATCSDRVGGIINITGINGSTDKLRLLLNIDNYTLKAMTSIPVFKNSAITFSLRKTYYNLYKNQTFQLQTYKKENTLEANPEYNFFDFNLKIAGKISLKSNYHISFLRGKDDYSYSILDERYLNRLSIKKYEDNINYAGSFYIDREWKSTQKTTLLQTISYFKSDSYLDRLIINKEDATKTSYFYQNTDNSLQEIKTQLKHYFPLKDKITLHVGIENIIHHINYYEDSLKKIISDYTLKTSRFNAFVNTDIKPINNFTLNLGARMHLINYLNKKIHFEPRIAFKYRFLNYFSINGAAGFYKQFIVKTSIVDEYGNYRYYWTMADNTNSYVLNSQHYISGISFKRKSISARIDGFYKITNGLSRYFVLKNLQIEKTFKGTAKIYGLDFFVSYDSKHISAWTSYTLSKALEKFPFFVNNEYRRALQDQRHEIKAAILFNFNPIYLSANYVYGSGFPDPTPIEQLNKIDDIPYSRFDAAILYKLPIKKLYTVVGVSIMNVFDTKNIRFSNFERIPISQIGSLNLNTEAVSFTPTLFLSIRF